MVSLRIQIPETLRSEFFRLCTGHEPRVSMNAALESVIRDMVAGAMPLPDDARDRRMKVEAPTKSPRKPK